MLTAEVLTALDFLPRRGFLGAVLVAAHGADTAPAALITEIEQADITFSCRTRSRSPPTRPSTVTGAGPSKTASIAPNGRLR